MLSRNNQQMSRHSTLFPVNSLHVSDTFRVHHQEINKINCDIALSTYLFYMLQLPYQRLHMQLILLIS
jgi:hypothetical protein